MEKKKKYSLLSDSLLGVRLNSGQKTSVSLPELYPILLKDEVLGFEALQAHQHQPWYSFLVQLGAMASTRIMEGKLPESAEAWKNALLQLTDNEEGAWCLINEHLGQPAFMQSPIPEVSLERAKYKGGIHTPDEMDMLVTSKNHDVKMSRMSKPDAEHWLFALLTLQTMEGFLGAGNYGVVRMNGGFGHRPFAGIAPGITWGNRITRDMKLLMQYRGTLSDSYDTEGYALLWTLPWDGSKNSGVALHKCDPYFIEICRRIRFTEGNNDEIVAMKANSKAARIFANEDLNGRTGDPWTPVKKDEAKIIPLNEQGFTYTLLQDLLLGETYNQPIAMEIRDDSIDGAVFITQVLIRGKGKTDGLHIRIIPIPSPTRKVLFKKESAKEALAKRSKAWVNHAGRMQKSVLTPALSFLLNSGENGKTDFKKLDPWIKAYNSAVDEYFFPYLWDSVEENASEVDKKWISFLYQQAGKQLKAAEKALPITDMRRLKAVSTARDVFEGSAGRHFDELSSLSNSKSMTPIL